MAFPLLGLLFAGGIGFKLHRRAASVDNFTDQFEAMGYDENQARHLGRVATDQGVGAAMQMHTARRQYQLANNPDLAAQQVNRDPTNPMYLMQMPDGGYMQQARRGSEDWLEFDETLNSAMEINDRMQSYFDKIRDVGLLQGTSTADGAALEAEGISIASDLARSKYGSAMSDDEFNRIQRMLSPDLVEAAIRGETTQMTLARIDQTMDDMERKTGRLIKRAMYTNGYEGRREELAATLDRYDTNTRDREVRAAGGREMPAALRAQRNLTAMAQMGGPIADVVQLGAIGAPLLGGLAPGGGLGGTNLPPGVQANPRADIQQLMEWINTIGGLINQGAAGSNPFGR